MNIILIRPAGKSNDPDDNEVSLSSERDSYKQKFSVATHPTLPMILCSDGYLLTIMKLEETYSLTSLVTSLVKISKAKLSQYNQMQGNIERSAKEKKRKRSLSAISLHDNPPDAFSDITNFPESTPTIQSHARCTISVNIQYALQVLTVSMRRHFRVMVIH